MEKNTAIECRVPDQAKDDSSLALSISDILKNDSTIVEKMIRLSDDHLQLAIENQSEQHVDSSIGRIDQMLESNRKKDIRTKMAIAAQVKLLHEICAGRGRDGRFGPTIEKYMPPARAHELIRVFNTFQKYADSVDLLDQFCIASLLEISKRSTPDEVKEEIFRLASEENAYISINRARHVISDAKPRDPLNGSKSNGATPKRIVGGSNSVHPARSHSTASGDPLFRDCWTDEGITVEVMVVKQTVERDVFKRLMEEAYHQINEKLREHEALQAEA